VFEWASSYWAILETPTLLAWIGNSKSLKRFNNNLVSMFDFIQWKLLGALLATGMLQILPKLDIEPVFLTQKQAEVSPGFKNSKSGCFLTRFFIALFPVVFCQI
jgi:hypothetical protein